MAILTPPKMTCLLHPDLTVAEIGPGLHGHLIGDKTRVCTGTLRATNMRKVNY